MNLWITLSVTAALIALVAIFAATIYNRLVLLRSNCENSFAQIETQLKRRYDLIPNLVECVKRYMAHEAKTLESVIAARNQAAASLAQASQQPQDSAILEKWMGAERSLNSALGQLNVAIESYPNLKADASVAGLTEELTSTENRIAFARQSYNDWVTGFNTSRLTFPNCLFAGVLGFNENRKHLEFADAAKLTEAPKLMLA